MYEQSASLFRYIVEFIGLGLPLDEFTVERRLEDWRSAAGELFVNHEDFRIWADLEGDQFIRSSG